MNIIRLGGRGCEPTPFVFKQDITVSGYSECQMLLCLIIADRVCVKLEITATQPFASVVCVCMCYVCV